MKLCRTRLNSEVIYSGKDSIRFQKTNDKKKEEAKSKLYGEKNVSTKVFRVCRVLGMRVPFRTKAVLREYHLFLRSKYIPAQTTKRQL